MAQDLPAAWDGFYGHEYVSPFYLPPNQFERYLVRYDEPMVHSIHRCDGCVRILPTAN
jgi:hypothetical protein